MINREGYNTINTIAYAFLFIFLSYLTFNLLKRLKIKIDHLFAISIFPFIASGVIIRVLHDAKLISGILFMTPNIWLLFFSLIIFMIILSVLIQNNLKIPYYKPLFLSGFIMFSILLPTIQIKNTQALLYFIAFFIPLCVLIIIFKTSIENKLVMLFQILDSIITSIAVTWFNYTEQHVLPRFLIEKTNTAFTFVLVKAIVIYFSLKLIDEYEKDKEFNFYIKMLIAILGFATGMRSLLRLLWGV
ncbi:MAG: DUF63 family protein [Candidatus Aenigmarchaeota archaeon]|nr:DUF63 family protein [Candidatus Aenigmarchaeota archaeon]